MQTLIQGVSGQQVHLAGSLVNRITGARLTSSATARICLDGTWGDATGTLSLEETDQWKYTLHDDEAAASKLVISVDHADATEPLFWAGNLVDPNEYERVHDGIEYRNGRRVWYVDVNTGDNGNPGTQSQPFESITQAESVMGPGDFCHVADGDYTTVDGAGIIVNVEGVTFEGESWSTMTWAWSVQADGVTIRNFYLNAPTVIALGCFQFHNCTFEDLKIDGGNDAILCQQSVGTVIRNILATATWDIFHFGGSTLLAERLVGSSNCSFAGGDRDCRAIICDANGGCLTLRNVQLTMTRATDNDTRRTVGIEGYGQLIGEGIEINVNCSNPGHNGNVKGIHAITGFRSAWKLNGIEVNTSSAGGGTIYDVDAAGTGRLDFTAALINTAKLNGSTNISINNVDYLGQSPGVTGNVSGRVLGSGATAFAGVGVRADNRDGQDITTPGDEMSLTDGAITANKIASAALTAAKFASGAFDAVWSTTTRLLTAGTNVVLAKGVGITGFNDLSQQEARDAMKLAPTVGAAGSNSVDDYLSTIIPDQLESAKTSLESQIDNVAGDTATALAPTLSAIQNSAASADSTSATINNKIGTPQQTLADDIGDIQAGGVVIPVIQVPVPASRTWILKQSGEGLRGELPIVRSVGESQPYAVDFRNDLPNNGRLISLDSIVVEGTENGIAIDSQDQGVDRSEAKFKIEALIAGTYVISVTASYDDSDGGGTSVGEVTLIVKA